MHLFKPILTNLLMWMKLTFQLLHSWVVFFIFWTPLVPAMVCDLEGVFNVTWLSQIYEDEHHFYWQTLRLPACCLFSSHLQRQRTFKRKRYCFSIGSIVNTHTHTSHQTIVEEIFKNLSTGTAIEAIWRSDVNNTPLIALKLTYKLKAPYHHASKYATRSVLRDCNSILSVQSS